MECAKIKSSENILGQIKNEFPKYQGIRNFSLGRWIIFQFGRTSRTTGEDLRIMNLKEGEINECMNTLQFRDWSVSIWISFLKQPNETRVVTDTTLCFLLSCVDLFIFINFQGHHALKLGGSERTHSSCQVMH